MRLTVMRHGDATQPNEDGVRVLSVAGREAVRLTGRALRERDVRPTQLWSSPLPRALQTAELVAGLLDYGGMVHAWASLSPDGSVGALLDRLYELPADADILLASHEPFVSTLSAVLLGSDAASFRGGFATAAASRFELAVAEPGGGRLLWRWERDRYVD